MTEAEKVEKEAEETKKKNYERLLLAIAVLYANQIDMDIKKQSTYQQLTPAQKTFAKKIYEEVPDFSAQVNQGERLTEQQIVEDMSQLSQAKNGSKKLRIVTVGDEKVCQHCQKWQNKIVSLDGSSRPSLQDAIDDGFLHYNCRCALQEIATTEIKLNKLNPRYETRAAANPAVYHCAARFNGLVFT